MLYNDCEASVYRGNIAVRACPNACCLRSRARLATASRRPAALSSCVWDALTVLWSFQPVAVLLARQTTQLSLPESKEDNAARGAATVLKTDVYPCTLMQVI